MAKEMIEYNTNTTLAKRPGRTVAAMTAFVLIFAAVISGGCKDDQSKDEPLYTVKKGPLTISATEAGRLQNKDEIIIKNETDRSLKILNLVEEGTVVTNGQLIVELDSDTLQTEFDSSKLNVQRIKSDLTAALEQREILKSKKQTDVDQAKLNVKFAKLDLKKAKEGLHPQVLETAKANIKTAEENLSQAVDDNHPEALETALENIALTEENLEKAINGTQPQSLESADASVMIAEENLERAQKDYAWSKKLHEKGFITLKELKADELSEKQAVINLSVAKTNRELLKKYTNPQELRALKRNLKNYKNDLARLKKYKHPQDVEYLNRMLKIAKNDLHVLETFTQPQDIVQLESNVKFNDAALERSKRSMKAELAGQMASLIHLTAELDRGTNDLIKAEERLDACNIYATSNGMIIYATSSGRHWGGERKPMEVGSTVHPKHKLIRMPTSNIMLAEISIQEATKPKIHLGMPVLATVDAVPGDTFDGKITKIGILPDASQAWLNPDLKVYKCEIELDADDKRLRPGMNCNVTIVIEEHDDVFFVPMQCVLQVDNKPTVYVKTGSKTEKRIVKTGMNNNVLIHILEGLKDGDKVLLSPPLDEATKKNGHGSHKKKSTDSDKKKSTTSKKNTSDKKKS